MPITLRELTIISDEIDKISAYVRSRSRQLSFGELCYLRIDAFFMAEERALRNALSYLETEITNFKEPLYCPWAEESLRKRAEAHEFKIDLIKVKGKIPPVLQLIDNYKKQLAVLKEFSQAFFQVMEALTEALKEEAKKWYSTKNQFKADQLKSALLGIERLYSAKVEEMRNILTWGGRVDYLINYKDLSDRPSLRQVFALKSGLGSLALIARSHPSSMFFDGKRSHSAIPGSMVISEEERRLQLQFQRPSLRP